MKIQKAGCILLDVNSKRIALVYREKQDDYSFPKGHLDEGETLEDCAVRETEEETGRKCIIIPNKKKYVLEYITSSGNNVIVNYYFAIDNGQSNNTFDKDLVHKIVWLLPEEMENKLSHKNLKDLWNEVKYEVIEIFNKY